ncbi:MAG: SPOR domain-containing protein, partial [bacterium]
AELPSLLSRYPNNSGVLYLQAVLTKDGAEAVRLYQDIVDKYPAGEWADDALYKVYKFYSAIGLNRTAEIKLNQLQTRYPDSRYVAELASESPGDTKGRVESSTSSEASTTTTPAPKPVTEILTPSEPKSTGNFTLQVGVYSTMGNASKQKQFFEYQHYRAEVASKISGDRELFAVYVGDYATADEARMRGDEIKQSFNINYLVVSR